MEIAALVSGGVDSSVTLQLMKEQGLQPTIFYIVIGMEDKAGYIDCPKEEDIEITSYLAKKYGFKMEIVDLHKEYWDTVAKYTLDTVKKGYTPNPDIMCNRLIKFGAFNEQFGRDFDLISTGHYAGTVVKDGVKYLRTAVDRHKDQTYFLSQISKEQLQKAMFPLQDIPKPRVREIAREMKLPSAERPDSQGICFLGKVNYRDFIKKYVGVNPGEIRVLETDKVIGEHQGLWFHTIGQRKGLGLGQGPWFVVKKNISENIIYVSNGYDPVAQYQQNIFLQDFQFIHGFAERDYSGEQDVKFKIRHTPEFASGKLIQDGDCYTILADEKIAGVAPGQFGVVYTPDEEICLGGGVIAEY